VARAGAGTGNPDTGGGGKGAGYARVVITRRTTRWRLSSGPGVSAGAAQGAMEGHRASPRNAVVLMRASAGKGAMWTWQIARTALGPRRPTGVGDVTFERGRQHGELRVGLRVLGGWRRGRAGWCRLRGLQRHGWIGEWRERRHRCKRCANSAAGVVGGNYGAREARRTTTRTGRAAMGPHQRTGIPLPHADGSLVRAEHLSDLGLPVHPSSHDRQSPGSVGVPAPLAGATFTSPSRTRNGSAIRSAASQVHRA
jgi:hypothetical protein